MKASAQNSVQVQPLNICFVTGEFIGPRNCGGIGTATTGLAMHLARTGHAVTVLFTRGYLLTSKEINRWQAHYKDIGIDFVPLSTNDFKDIAGPLTDLTFATPSAVLNHLLNKSFDLIHFNDLEAEGYLAVAARRMGLAFQNTPMAVGLHSPRAWIEAINKELLLHPVALAMDAAERFCVSNCDVLWGPSRYLLDWIERHDFVLPAKTAVQQYVLPPLSLGNSAGPADPHTVKSLVFFGRIEERKGIYLFLDALDLLNDQLSRENIEVVFLGANTIITGVASDQLIKDRARSWTFNWRQLGALPHARSLDLLQTPGHLAVMASLEDNSPCTVYEAMALGIPFLAAATGGIPELIETALHRDVLFEPNAQALAERLHRAIETAPKVPRPAVEQLSAAEAWSKLHDRAHGWPAIKMSDAVSSQNPFGIVVDGHCDDAGFARTMASISSLELKPAFVAVCSRQGKGPAEQGTLFSIDRKQLMGWLDHPTRKDCPLLLVNAGVNLVSASVAALVRQMSAQKQSLVLPSVQTENGRCDAPVLSGAMAYALGPLPTACAFIGVDLKNHILEKQTAGSIPQNQSLFAGLVDLAICDGALVMPYPQPVGHIQQDLLNSCKPVQSPQRLSLYSNLGLTTQMGLARLAATQAMAAPRFHQRSLLLRLLQSRLAFALPYMEGIANKMNTFRKKH